MAIISFLTSHWDDVVALATVAAGYLGIKKRGSNFDAAKERIAGKLRIEVYRVLADPKLHARADAILTSYAVRALGELKITGQNALTIAEPLVDAALEIFARELFTRQLNGIAASTAAVAAKLGEVK
jgi:hypothetical protein